MHEFLLLTIAGWITSGPAGIISTPMTIITAMRLCNVILQGAQTTATATLPTATCLPVKADATVSGATVIKSLLLLTVLVLVDFVTYVAATCQAAPRIVTVLAETADRCSSYCQRSAEFSHVAIEKSAVACIV
ncbi:hypothetical protein ACHAWO_005695 [Cyclotella atomus]|uniref:Uncharacterized protein n=1 Tax=Cyclotella atomus TaxID=382360 RepID=A0ABD3P8K3_9STRA